eukprot:gnl/TRDRNA2_/TRDRNA2_172169_c2_seq2.p2 gnl/TRDRNA2_/TRDRNA2_172169_c2~~gnl/TRDRNA2_/TRDRNA2_172169_c2_seq2.p2  ORF type:complete len:147 (+),score=26.00 gnl/TRDRNA2_/TRDRNA2_172169_c2_seq2:876-1316(+)
MLFSCHSVERSLKFGLQAELLVRRVLARAEGVDRQQVLATLAHPLYRRGALSEASSAMALAVSEGRMLLGEDEPMVLEWMAELGSLVLRQGRTAEAKRWMKKALRGLEGSGSHTEVMLRDVLGRMSTEAARSGGAKTSKRRRRKNE